MSLCGCHWSVAHPVGRAALFCGDFRVVPAPFWLPGPQCQKGLGMFDKTKAKLSAPIERATGIAALALAVALVALLLSIGKVVK